MAEREFDTSETVQLRNSYMPQLDGLRFIAITTVICEHYLPEGHPLKLLSAWGTTGVWLFFVISGFLISDILIRCADFVRSKRGTTSSQMLLRFYARRALRIFPAYFLVLGVVLFANLPGVRASWGWHAGYATNIWLAHGLGGHTAVGHFWTLAIEEQFYLLWPFVLLSTPPRWRFYVVVCVIFAAPVATLIAWEYRFWGFVYYMPSQMNLLGIGALVAVCLHPSSKAPMTPQLLERWLLIISAPVLVVYLWLTLIYSVKPAVSVTFIGWLYSQGRTLAIAFLFGWIVSRAASGISGSLGKALSWRPVRYVGKISYGIYLWHVPMIWLLPMLFQLPGLRVLAPEVHSHRFFGLTCATLAVAALSWHLFEHPINRLKLLVPYDPRTRAEKPDYLLVATGGRYRG